jgi:predicted nuclease with TOPRIM domain
MSSDDLTRNQPNDDEDKETQPTITAVFRLLQDVGSRLNARIDDSEARLNARLDETESRLNARLDKTDARLDQIESRLAGDIEGVNTRVTEVNTRVTDGFKELIHKTKALNRRALQSEADYEELDERMERLESKAS